MSFIGYLTESREFRGFRVFGGFRRFRGFREFRGFSCFLHMETI